MSFEKIKEQCHSTSDEHANKHKADRDDKAHTYLHVVFLYVINSKVSIRMTHATYGLDACGTLRCVACCVSDVTARVQHGRPPVVMEALIKVLRFDTGGAELLLMSQPGMAAEVKSKARLKQQLCMMGLLGLSSRLKPDQHMRPSVSSVCWNTTAPR